MTEQIAEQWTIFFNPKCGTCQKVLAILNEKGINPKIVEYLRNPPSLKTLDGLVHLLRIPALDMLRAKEPVFEKLHLSDGKRSRKDLLRIVTENPVLLQRPIVLRGNRAAVIARPPEKVLELF